MLADFCFAVDDTLFFSLHSANVRLRAVPASSGIGLSVKRVV
jgi:hypothetical protein